MAARIVQGGGEGGGGFGCGDGLDVAREIGCEYVESRCYAAFSHHFLGFLGWFLGCFATLTRGRRAAFSQCSCEFFASSRSRFVPHFLVFRRPGPRAGAAPPDPRSVAGRVARAVRAMPDAPP